MKTIFAESVEGRRAPGLALPVDDDAPRAVQMLPEALLRKSAPRLPQCSELDVVRHFTNLSKLNYSVDANFYPLGSCTMKYNPKFTEYVASLPGFARMHPLLAQLSGELAQGALQCLYDAEQWLCEVTGMKAFTFQPMAGANGEYTGVKLIAAYHKARGRKRTKMLIPDSAHGTNPASAVLAGFEIVNVPSRDGMVDPAALEEALAKYPDQVAGLMMTNPNTLGLLELHLPRIVEVLRREDALLYYDGANMNAILGKMRVGDVGFDVVHLNVHKTLGTPHGGGGPGCGPVGVGERLLPFLPAPRVRKAEDGSYALDYDLPQSIGHIGPFYGSFGVVLKALAYMMRLGAEGLTRAAEFAASMPTICAKSWKACWTCPSTASAPTSSWPPRPKACAPWTSPRPCWTAASTRPRSTSRSSSMNASWPSPRRPRASRPWMPTSRPCARSWPWASPIPSSCWMPR